MQVLSMRYCTVEPQAADLLAFFDKLGLPRKPPATSQGEAAAGSAEHTAGANNQDLNGGVFLAGQSWIEVWQESTDMPAGVILQIVVDDAEAFAQIAQTNGLSPHGPVHAHGETIYFLTAPSGLNVTVQSADSS